MDESGTDGAKCSRKAASGRRVAGYIRSLVNAKDLQREWARVWREILLAPVLMYGIDTMLWKEKEISRVRDVQMDNLRGLLGIKRLDRVPSTRIRKGMRSEEGSR